MFRPSSITGISYTIVYLETIKQYLQFETHFSYLDNIPE